MGTAALVLRLLDLLVGVTSALPQIQALRAKLEQFNAEGRDPTPAEWNALFGNIQSDSDRLNAAAQRMKAPKA